MTELRDLYQEVILDHNKRPRNFRVPDPVNRKAEGYNPLCGDKITVFLYVEGDTIKDLTFQGTGCAISKASASMMTDELKGKTLGEADAFFAPDASVLLSPSFASTHCFGLVAPPPGREALIGIEFRPNAPRRGHPDIEGTFWLDRASAELRSLDFRYTELPAPTERAEPGIGSERLCHTAPAAPDRARRFGTPLGDLKRPDSPPDSVQMPVRSAQ